MVRRMVTATPVHPEGPRYAAPIAYLSGLWIAPRVWQHVATYLGHRGWEGRLLDTRTVRGGIAARGDAVAAYLSARGTAPVLLAHDAGAPVAIAVASLMEVRALVLVSPLVPGAPGTHALAWSRALVWGLLRRRALGPPSGRAAEAYFDAVPHELRATAEPEDARLLSQLARRSRLRRPARVPPTLVLRGSLDPFVSADDAARTARDLGGDVDEIPGHGHWLLVPPASHECVHRVHRWLVQRLGEDVLEQYAEAMAARDDDDH
jgi:predicted alpha/beta hydrolase family esterase